MIQPVLFTNIFDRKRSLDDLIEESKADSDFHFHLLVSAVITTLGLLSNNTAVVIGGMLVAPLLYPILALSMGVATSSRQAILRSLQVLWRSIALTVGVSFFIALLFMEEGALSNEVIMRVTPGLEDLFIAIFAGLAAAFGWVKKRGVSSTLAGIAVAVSLIPPLSVVAIGIASFSRTVIAGSLTLFIINLIGIVLAGIIVFALFGFQNLQQDEESKIAEEEIEKQIQDKAVKESEEKQVIVDAQGHSHVVTNKEPNE